MDTMRALRQVIMFVTLGMRLQILEAISLQAR
jgi:hypothetical protein